MELYKSGSGSDSGQKQGEWAPETGLEEPMQGLNLWEREREREREVYPERPGLPDCSYYMRTGSCGYGAKCRYNHPPDRGGLIGVAQYPERLGEPVCQYYLRTGTCKFGISCKFDHPKHAGGSLANAPLNIYGYPLRPGEKECSYYLQKGHCKFGLTCKFHHPQPAGFAARPFYSTVQSPAAHPPEQYDASSSGYKVARPPVMAGSFIPGAYGPMLLHPGVMPMTNWNTYSAPVSPGLSPSAHQPSIGAASVYGMSQLSSAAPAYGGSYPQVASAGASGEGKFPERPGQPDCKHYMRTGECKYGSSCRYNHPPDWVVQANVTLSSSGLPLRPGVQACPYYMQKGLCKFGHTCKFDHPERSGNYNPPSYTEMPG